MKSSMYIRPCVDIDAGTGSMIRQSGAKERHHRGNVLWSGEFVQRNVIECKFLTIFRQYFIGHIRASEAWSDQKSLDSLLPIMPGYGPSQTDNCPFGSGISNIVRGVTPKCRPRGNIYDPAILMLFCVRYKFLAKNP